MCCRCDQEIHDPRSGLPAGVSDGGRELAVAGGHIVVDRKGVEFPLQLRKPPQPFGSNARVGCYEHPEVQFGEGNGADRKLPRQLGDVGSDQHAGVKTAFNSTLPRVPHRLIGQLPVALPVGVGSADEQPRDVIPPLPSSRHGRNHPRREPTGNRDLDLLTVLHPPHELGRVLTKFSQSHSRHTSDYSTSATTAAVTNRLS